MRKNILFIISILLLVILGIIIFYLIENKNYKRYSGTEFKVNYKEEAIVLVVDKTTYFYKELDKYPYITITKYENYKTSDDFFNYIDTFMKNKYSDIVIGIRSFETINGNIFEKKEYKYTFNNKLITEIKYTFIKDNNSWVISEFFENQKAENLLKDILESFEIKKV